MRSEIRCEFEKALGNVVIEIPRSFSFNNISYEHLANKMKKGEDAANDPIFQLIKLIYQNYHCKQLLNIDTYEIDRTFILSLSDANKGKGSWEDGWEIETIQKKGYIKVHKNHLALWTTEENFIAENGSIRIGTRGCVSIPKEFRSLLPGFYIANGDLPIKDTYNLRLYLNLSEREAAIHLTKAITTEFNNANIPFRLKILSNPNYFVRTDAAVIYTSNDELGTLRRILSNIYEKIKYSLNADTSIFAKHLAPGLGLAEDPNNGESFGQNRSRILAEALTTLYKKDKNKATVQQQIKFLSTYFSNLGYDPNHIYLDPHSSKYYDELMISDE